MRQHMDSLCPAAGEKPRRHPWPSVQFTTNAGCTSRQGRAHWRKASLATKCSPMPCSLLPPTGKPSPTIFTSIAFWHITVIIRVWSAGPCDVRGATWCHISMFPFQRVQEQSRKVEKTKKKLKRQEFEKTESQRRKVEKQLTHLQSFAQMLYQIPSELSATGEVWEVYPPEVH